LHAVEGKLDPFQKETAVIDAVYPLGTVKLEPYVGVQLAWYPDDATEF